MAPFKWPTPLRECHIAIKELVPIMLVAALWEKEWTSKTVMARCDNAAVVAVLNKGPSKEADIMQLLWCMSFIQAKYQFNLFSTHIIGNTSWLMLCQEKTLRPSSLSTHRPESQPTPLPAEQLDQTVIRKPDWTSQTWTDLWNANFGPD